MAVLMYCFVLSCLHFCKSKIVFISLLLSQTMSIMPLKSKQCCRSVLFSSGSGSANSFCEITVTDPDPDPNQT